MASRRAHQAVLACSVVALLLLVPTQSSACAWLSRLFGCCPARTTYMLPYVPAPGRAPVSCVPQTTYRAVCRRIPVTSYRPITSCNPYTGRQVTSYRPITTWVSQRQLVPYTSYRTAYATPSRSCYTAPVAYYGRTVGGIVTTSASSCCGGTVVGARVPTVAPTPVYQTPVYQTPVYQTPVQQITPQPAAGSNGSNPNVSPSLPSVTTPNTTYRPSGLQSTPSNNRTAISRPIRQPSVVQANPFRLASAPQYHPSRTASPSTTLTATPTNASGWYAVPE